MIVLHRLNGTEFILNDHHIETLEETPDTVITLMNEKKYVVTESADEIINKIVAYQGQIHNKTQKSE
ncbi:MAG: flagellar protein [Spirochaetes bacterium RBG_13_51_14]|nr:MAG: flagellar protein [Spirochaetes bacterium RBG_13_51_14]